MSEMSEFSKGQPGESLSPEKEKVESVLEVFHSEQPELVSSAQRSETRLDAGLEDRVQAAFDQVELRAEDRTAIEQYLSLLREHHGAAHQHSLRVGLLARAIAHHEQQDERALLIAGLLHDVGKAGVPQETLEKKVGWTPEDKQHMDRHVIDGFELLRGRFDFTAEIVLRHHQFQSRKYPTEFPPQLQDWTPATRQLIERDARLLALADVYDALNHHNNDRFDQPDENSAENIRAKMLELNPDEQELIAELYDQGVFSADASDLPKVA